MELFDSSRIDCFILSDDQKGAFPDICISEPAIGNCPKPPAAAGCEEIGQFDARYSAQVHAVIITVFNLKITASDIEFIKIRIAECRVKLHDVQSRITVFHLYVIDFDIAAGQILP